MDDYAEHLLFGSWFAGPDFELTRALLHEHLDAGDDGDVLLAGEAQQRCLQWVVDEIEDELGVQVFRFEDLIALLSCHAYGCGVDDDVERGFGECVFLD